MKTFAEKLKDARTELGLSQAQLGEACGISSRAIQTYEQGQKKPRQGALLKIAKTLRVSVKFLSDDGCENPVEDIEKDGYIAEAREQYGAQGGRDIDSLLSANKALFAGGELSQEQKDKFFEAVMTAYVSSKEAAKEKFGRKNG